MRRVAVYAAALFSCVGAALAAPPAPTNLQINCGNGLQTNPTNCTNFTPSALSWSDSSAFNAYQIRVDVGPSFIDCWLWDPPVQSVTSTTTHSVSYPGSRTPVDSCGQSTLTLSRQAPYRGGKVFHWRVRVSDDGGSTFSPYTNAQFMYSLPPSPPGSIAVATSATTGTNWSDPGDTSVTTNRYVDSVACSGNYSIANRSCTGSDGTSYTTISACATAAAAGDICWVRSGSYPGTTITGAGTRAKPKTLKGYAAETATVTTTLTLSGAYWTVDRLTFSSSSGASLIYNAANLVVQNSHFTGSGVSTASSQGTIIFGGNTSNYFLNNIANPASIPAGDVGVLTPNTGVDQVYRGNEITVGSTGERGIVKTGGQNSFGNYEMTENYIHNIPGSNGACVEWYYGTGEGFVARNYFHNCSDGTHSMLNSRGDWATYLNNTWGKQGHNDYCYTFAYSDGAPNITNDACISTSIVMNYSSQEWHETVGKVQWRYSNYWRNGGGSVQIADPSNGCLANGTDCVTFTNVTSIDPLTVDGRPIASSAALINLGDPNSPVPVGGGARVDIGKFEFGSAAISSTGGYEYQPRWTVADTTPRVSWTFVDPNNVFGSAGNTQSSYEVQLDTDNHFNSLGPWTPLCSSGKIASVSNFWDVPAACNLQNGTKYYVRVRTWGSDLPNADGTGLWSDYANAFLVSGAVSSTTYYVDGPGGDGTTGSDSNNGTSTSTPFLTWQKAISVAVAGDTVYGRGGTYNVTSFALQHTAGQGVSGTAGLPITYTNYNGENVILDMTNTTNTHGTGVGIDNHATYVVFRGLKITNSPEEGFDNRGDNVTIDQCEFYNNGRTGGENNFQNEDGADGLTITRSKFYWTPSFVSLAPECAATPDDRVCTEHNVYMQGNNITFMNNYVYDTWGQGTSPLGTTAYGIQVGSTGLTYDNITIAYNTVAHVARRAAIVLFGGTALTNVRIYNNILKDANIGPNASTTGSIWLSPSGSSQTIANNIFDTTASPSGIGVNSGSGHVSTGNLTTGAGFTDYATRNLHITSGSAARDAASSTVTTSVDWDGDTRPQGAAYDIGADEFTGVVVVCGNNIIDGTDLCDGTALGGATCVSLGYAGGTLSCNSDCLSYNTSLCTISSPITGVKRGVTKR